MTDPTAAETDAMQQVLSRICAERGHQHSFDNVLNFAPDAPSIPVIRAQDDTRLPHVNCLLCGMVWLVIEDPGVDYDDAETKLRGRLYKSDTLNKRPERPGRPTPAADV